METFQFNHESSKLREGLGISDVTDRKCREIVFFSMISNHFMADELFDDIHQAPKQLTTMTGDLEKCLNLCQTDKEKGYILLVFKELHNIGTDAIAKYMVFNGTTGRKREELSLLLQLLNLDIAKKAEKEDSDFVTPKELFNKIELVKKSRYDFNKYLQLANGDHDADEILNSVFKDDKSTN